MSIEFVGSLVNASANNSFARSGRTDADYPARMARLHEESGFDRLLVGHSSSSPDGFTVADTVLNATSRRRTGAALDHKGSAGSLRLAEFADQAEIHDKRLWTPLAKTPTAGGNSTALVGSYQQIAESLLDYVAIGVSTLLIRGYDPEGDAADYARIINLVRDQEPALACVGQGA